MGTPDTLKGAIENAHKSMSAKELPAETIERHVRDFIAQLFSAALLENADTPTEAELQKLWESITRENGMSDHDCKTDDGTSCTDCCEHGDTDGGQCLDCGSDRTEHMMAAAYDRAKDRD